MSATIPSTGASSLSNGTTAIESNTSQSIPLTNIPPNNAIPDANPTNNNDEGSNALYPSTSSILTGGGGNDDTFLSPSAPVPDVLLSLAKDDRYISQLSSLLARFIIPFASIIFPPRGRNVDHADGRVGNAMHSTSRQTNSIENDNTAYDGQEIIEDDGRKFIERLKPEIDLLASMIVHSAMFVFYTRHYYSGENNGKGRRKNEAMNRGTSSMAVKRSLGMESLNLAYLYQTRESNQRKRPMQHNSNSSFRWHYLMFLQTVIPYVVQRAGRGGWSKDLGLLVSTLVQPRGFGRGVGERAFESRDITANEPNREDPSHAENENDNELRNDDMLRGVARRRLFEEQRRRMMSSASGSTGDSEVHRSEDNMLHVGESSDENEPSGATSSESAVNVRISAAMVLNRFYNMSWNFFKVRQFFHSRLVLFNVDLHLLPRIYLVLFSSQNFPK